MIESEALKVVKFLRHAFPRQDVPNETVEVYVSMMLDLPYEAATKAARTLATTSNFFPTLAEIRAAVAEASVGAPSDVTAWELVQARAWRKPTFIECAACNGRCFEGGDLDSDVPCRVCGGHGEVEQNPPEPLPELVRRAVEACGGIAAIRGTDNLNVVRAQFRDTYRLLRDDAVRSVQTGERRALPPTEKLAALPMPELREVPRA